jgi:uncharacterized protein
MPLGPDRRSFVGRQVVIPGLDLPALYEGQVTHRRKSPFVNRFSYRACYWLVDYDRLPQPEGLMRHLTRVQASDHTDVRAVLATRGIDASRVLMLSCGRSLGYVFNPISIFWCFDRRGARTAVVAEVHNTYGERYSYLLEPDAHGSAVVDKAMYVSPFYPVDGRYRLRVGDPGPTVSVAVTLEREGEEGFVATLRAKRLPATSMNVLRSALRWPAARTSILIRWQAYRLWLRGLRVVPR